MAVFENPMNGYRVSTSSLAWLWTLLFGIFYFAYKGLWKHVFFGFFLALITLGISWLIYPFFIGGILKKQYLMKGFKQIG